MDTPDSELLKIIKSLPKAELQNSLMRISDRDLAVSLQYIKYDDRQLIFKQLGPIKAQRVGSELLLLKRVRLGYKEYRMIIETVIARIKGGRNKGFKSYLRPGFPGRR